MKIQNMFKEDINRPINGVIQVEQSEETVILQEVQEYVITSELKKHFNKFFDSYSRSFESPTDNTGVWIKGFFGSGKSHFLKMLSYLLENKEIGGKSTVDYFREKYDDELSFMPIVKATSVPTETILFNLNFYQKEPVGDKFVARTYEIYFTNASGKTISDKQKIIADRTSKNNKDRDFRCMFHLNSNTYSNTAIYYLVIEDEKTHEIIDKEEFQIDISFVDDFDF